MVRDGIFYGVGFIAVAALMAWFLGPAYAIPALLFAGFFLQFFRDPERPIPSDPAVLVSAADGKVTDITTFETPSGPRTRVSVFLNVFDVHVNRSPVSGVISNLEYRKGRFRNAMGGHSAEVNEQNIITIAADDGHKVVVKQIAGLLARRIVCNKKVGDRVERGERIGMIKFGSRTDLIFDASAIVRLRVGDRVKGGSTVVATAQPRDTGELVGTARIGDKR
jgi:phosphatidylserine decarboxylase